MLIGIAIIVILALFKWLLYTGLIWGMIKIQKLNYNVLGLFGSTVLAVLLNFVPIVGCYLSWAVLVLCLWKVTNASIAPDVIFTVAIPSAIMFVLNLWVFAGVMTIMANVLPSSEFASADDEDDPPGLEEEVDAPQFSSTASKDTSAKSAPKSETTSPIKKVTASIANVTGPIFSRTQTTNAVDYGIKLKGVVMYSTQPSAMIAVSNKVYTVVKGETLNVPTAKGRINMRCNSVESSAVSLTVNDAQELVLRVY